MMKRKNRKLLSMLTAFVLNVLIIVFATWIYYYTSDVARIFGLGDAYILLFFIPIVTWVNFIILASLKKKEIQA